jgi:hypothetical protein
VTSTAGLGRPRRWAAGLAWGLWALAMVGLAVVPWLDSLLRQAGRPDLAVWVPGSIVGPILAVLGAATVGAVVASRRPRHPVGWLLLGFALSLTASGVIAASVTYGLVARPGALPAAATVARYYPATGAAALALLSLVLLLTPTGSLPSARWRWWAWITAATPLALVLVVAVVPGRLDPQLLLASSPLSDRALGGVLLVATRVALVVTTLAVAVAAASLVVRFRRAQGVERQQLGWVALAAGPDGAGGADRPGPRGAGEPDLGRLGVRGLGDGAAGGRRGGGPALSAVRPGPDHQPHPGLRAADAAAGWWLCPGRARVGPAPGPRVPSGGGGRDPGRGGAVPAGPAAASRLWWIGASTGAATTRHRSSRTSGPACVTRSTSTP